MGRNVLQCVLLFSCVSGMTGFEKDCLKAHNEYRAKHGVPPLKWNAQLQADAQKWANHLAAMSKYFPRSQQCPPWGHR